MDSPNLSNCRAEISETKAMFFIEISLPSGLNKTIAPIPETVALTPVSSNREFISFANCEVSSSQLLYQ